MSDKTKMNKIEKTIAFRAKPGAVDEVDGLTVIHDVSVTTEGEALGHGVWLEEEFVQAVVDQGNALKMGAKARFGHPTMCSQALGTYLGRFKNFRMMDSGTGKAKAIADMHLSESAKKSPSGNIHDYVAAMAQSESDMFGASIVFQPGETYRKNEKNGRKAFIGWTRDGEAYWTYEDGEDADEKDLSSKLYASIKKLEGADFVDSPAANPDGLYSEFSAQTIAGQVGQFFDEFPDVVRMLATNPEIVQIMKNHGDKIDVFLAAYTKEKQMAEETQTEVEKEIPPAETAPETPAATPEQEQPAEYQMPVSEYRDIALNYGLDIAEKCFAEKAGKTRAVELYAANLKSENDKLKKQLSAVPADESAGEGVSFTEKDTKPKRSLTKNLKI
jgi:hypothetical protein